MLPTSMFQQAASMPLLGVDLSIQGVPNKPKSQASSHTDMIDALYLLTTSDGNMVEDELNMLILSNIRQCITSPVADVASKRKVFENAIDAGYKKLLNQMFDEIRRGGERIYLDSVDLSGLDLSDLDMSQASATRCNFSNAKLKRSNLSGASLVCANLSRVRAIQTNFEQAVFECTMANRLVTDNPLLARSYLQLSDSLAQNVEIINVYLHGIGQAKQSGKKIFILPSRIVNQSCCPCVVL